MRRILLVVPALILAGCAAGQEMGRADPLSPAASAPPAEHRSAFEGYRPFADPALANWRKANEEVGAAAAKHGGHK